MGRISLHIKCFQVIVDLTYANTKHTYVVFSVCYKLNLLGDSPGLAPFSPIDAHQKKTNKAILCMHKRYIFLYAKLFFTLKVQLDY